MQLRKIHDAPVHTPPMPNGPIATVLFGGDEQSPDVGLVRVEVAAGSGMPPHQHGGSDVILTPLTGTVEITRDQETIRVEAGDAAFISKDETVALTNVGDDTAQLLVAAGPSNFISGIRAWPEVAHDQA